MSKAQRPLAEAERVAAALVADLEPYCARIATAGSVRRRKVQVGDIELVAIPRYEPAGLFGDRAANRLWEHLHTSDAYRFTKGDHPDGRYYCTRRRRIDPSAPIWLDPSFSSSSFLACALISGRC